MAKQKTTKKRGRVTQWPVRYKKDFLDQVIARIDFAVPPGIQPSGPPQQVVTELRQRFPVPEHKKILVKSVYVRPAAAQSVTEERQEERHEWWYHSKDRQKVIKIADGSLVLKYNKNGYRSFDDLEKDFLPVAGSLFDVYDGLQVQRLGLRYIDRIEMAEGKPTDWHSYLRKDLLAIFNLADDASTVSRALHWLEFNYGDIHLRFQYGMANPDYPAPIRQKVFTLDYDAYCTLLVSKDEVPCYLARLHEHTRPAFEEVILDPLRQHMEPVYANAGATVSERI